MSTEQALTDHLRRVLDDERTGPLCVACSGGPDSTALLHALASLPEARARGLRALHVDHGLHPDSADWARACVGLAASLRLELRVLPVEVDRASGEGLEAAARRARYAALGAALADDERLLTAHHRDDQAETFLLRALRAAGPDALGAMRPLRRLGRGWLWRPLLPLGREALLEHLARHGLDAIDDPANRDPRHDRSRLRSELLPLLRRRWPQAAASLAASAALCAEAAALLDTEDAAALARARGADPATLQVPALLALPAARRARVLRRWIESLGLPPLPAQGIATLEGQLLPARRDAKAQFRWHGSSLTRWRHLLHAGPVLQPLPADLELAWNPQRPLALPGQGRLLLAAAPGGGGVDGPAAEFRVRARRGGERLRLPGHRHSHALKHLLQEAGVPPWERARLPLVFAADGELLAAGDRVLSATLVDWLRSRELHLVWHT